MPPESAPPPPPQPDLPGPFRIGYWHDTSQALALEWDKLREGEPFGPLPWTVEPFEAALICFLGDSAPPDFLPTRLQPLPAVHPAAALWAAVSLRKTRYRFTGVTDYRHELVWDHPLQCGEPATLRGSIASLREQDGRREICVATECIDAAGERIFRIEQTAVLPRAAGAAPRPKPAAAAVPAIDVLQSECLFSRRIDCHLAWARRPVFPLQPNLHTDADKARAAGFSGVVMTGLLVASRVIEGAYEFLGAQRFYGARLAYRMLRPVPAEGSLRLEINRTAVGELEIVLRGEGGKALFAGSIMASLNSGA